VGLDGSDESVAAARWGAGEAVRRGLPLCLLHADEGLPTDASTLPELEAPRLRARDIVRGATDDLAGRCPQLHPTVRLVARPAAEALLTAGAEAELLVLGSQAFGAVGGLMAGSVAMSVVAHATRPVVLVRAGQRAEDVPHGAGPGGVPAGAPHVVVGVDTAQPCDDVLSFAFESASLRSAALEVVRTWRPGHGHAPEARAGVSSREDVERGLAAALRPWREKYPGVAVRATVGDGRPAENLTRAAADACLLVVGRRTRPERLGMHIGPVAHAVIQDVPCPVAVVPHA
jgi:nucleotide-binding universal stress UspA family protein